MRGGRRQMIYQELSLAPHLSVAENVVLGMEPARLGLMRWGEARERRGELWPTRPPGPLRGRLITHHPFLARNLFPVQPFRPYPVPDPRQPGRSQRRQVPASRYCAQAGIRWWRLPPSRWKPPGELIAELAGGDIETFLARFYQFQQGNGRRRSRAPGFDRRCATTPTVAGQSPYPAPELGVKSSLRAVSA